MDFKFIEAASVRAVVSCKSLLKSIDNSYPKALKKYGVENVFLFAECCPEAHLLRLRKRAESAGYRGLWCLYFDDGEGASFKTDESMYIDFADKILKAVKS